MENTQKEKRLFKRIKKLKAQNSKKDRIRKKQKEQHKDTVISYQDLTAKIQRDNENLRSMMKELLLEIFKVNKHSTLLPERKTVDFQGRPRTIQMIRPENQNRLMTMDTTYDAYRDAMQLIRMSSEMDDSGYETRYSFKVNFSEGGPDDVYYAITDRAMEDNYPHIKSLLREGWKQFCHMIAKNLKKKGW